MLTFDGLSKWHDPNINELTVNAVVVLETENVSVVNPCVGPHKIPQ